jgi:CheY-like chemotaxis protein
MIKTVLVADDSPDNRAIYGAYLTYLGYRVVEACDGREAFDLALRETPDLILLDIEMPNLSGPEVLRMLRDSEPALMTPIIGITAYVVGQRFTHAELTGFQEMLWKPIEPREVGDVVRRHIGEPTTTT